MNNVDFVRPDVAALMPQYTLIRDAISGEVAVKAAGETYLPRPGTTGDKKEDTARYEAYKKRAVYYNVTRRTLTGLVGHVFARPPEKKLPKAIEIVDENADGAGVSLDQQAKQALSYTLAYSRAGLLVDYPETKGGATRADIASGRVRPTIALYTPQEIINWRVEAIGAEDVLTLVVLAECYPFADDGFEAKEARQFRVLRLVNKQYIQEVWREEDPTEIGKVSGKQTFVIKQTIVPRGPDGNPLSEIPFTFIGAVNNNSSPDNPNFYDLASLNIAHYRNSADYEESCFIVGQPTVVATGLDKSWVEDILKGQINFGSRGGIPLPAGADAKMLQASPNTMIKEAMDTKERQMVALGAKLVEQRTVQRTAFEASVDAANEGSILSSCADNVSSAYKYALGWCARFSGVDDAVTYRLNTDFDLAKMSADEIRTMIESWQSDAITWKEMRAGMRKAGLATQDDDVAKAEIEADTMPSSVPVGYGLPSVGVKETAPASGDCQARNPIGSSNG